MVFILWKLYLTKLILKYISNENKNVLSSFNVNTVLELRIDTIRDKIQLSCKYLREGNKLA